MAATIKDVARLANTSTATVSKVMNGSYSISEATIERVNRAMEELDYHPNLRARNFSRQSTKTIMWIATLEKGAGFSNPHMFEILSGLEKTLSEKGYFLLVKSVPQSEVIRFVEEVYHAKIADGFVLHASVISEELDALIESEQIPHLIVGMPNFPNHFSWIDIDNRLAGELAAKYLLEQGYQSLAYIGGMDSDKISLHRLDGIMSVLSEHDLILPKSHLKRGESVCESGYRMAEQVLSAPAKPDAIICANNYIAYGCMQALADLGIAVPREMGVITFDEFPFSQLLKPRLSVVNIDVFDLGQQAGKYILQMIKKPNMHIQSYITYPEIMERESTEKKV